MEPLFDQGTILGSVVERGLVCEPIPSGPQLASGPSKQLGTGTYSIPTQPKILLAKRQKPTPPISELQDFERLKQQILRESESQKQAIKKRKKQARARRLGRREYSLPQGWLSTTHKQFLSDVWRFCASFEFNCQPSPVLYCDKTAKPPVPLKLFRHVIRSADLPFAHPPRCCPGTCIAVVDEITTWMANKNRQSDMLWLHGPTGVGKSTLTHTIHDRVKAMKIACIKIGFSLMHTVHWGVGPGPTLRLLATIAYGLASVHEGYGKWVARTLAANRSLPTKDPHVQLDELLITHFSGRKINQKFLIIIDGLDICERDHENIVNLIVDTVKAPKRPPFIWVLCTRQEPLMFSGFRMGRPPCWTKSLSSEIPEVDHDIEVYLRHELKSIPRISDEQWPPQEDLNRMVEAAAGSFSYAGSILGIIKDPRGHPRQRLRAVIDYLDDPSTSQIELTSLNATYEKLLTRGALEELPESLQLFGVYTINPSFSIIELANLFGLSQGRFYFNLRRLSAVITNPLRTMASERRLGLHASFLEFLKPDPHLGSVLEHHQFYDRVSPACFKILSKTKTPFAQNLSWKPDSPRLGLSITKRLFVFAATHVWDLWTHVKAPLQTPVWETVVDFDFRCLRHLSSLIPAGDFMRYVFWLRKVKRADTLKMARVLPKFDVDSPLIQKCEKFAKPLNLESYTPMDELDGTPRYVLLGRGAKTVIAILISESVTIYSMEYLDDL